MNRVLLIIALIATTCAGCGYIATEDAPPKLVSALSNGEDSVCEIPYAGDDTIEYWGVYGATMLPRGTVFTLILEYDGQTRVAPMVAKAGSIYVNGKLYGYRDGYIDDGTNTSFGFTSLDMPTIAVPHGPVSARVMQDDHLICERG